ncbi:MAG TPA: hypothetical protein GX693_07305 [Firmicutes bacterium]|nr:hypothetical protein [Bacillota bacterium]
MKVLLVGAGGVGEAIAKIAGDRDPGSRWLQKMVLADYNLDRAKQVAEKVGEPERFPAEQVDAQKISEVAALARKYGVDLILDTAPPFVTKNLFDAAFESGCHYINLGTWSEPHPDDPVGRGYTELMASYNFQAEERWQQKGLMAVIGAGIDPGVVDVFAKFAEIYCFDELDEIAVKDGGNLTAEGLDIAFGFSIWTMIGEILNPPVTWEREKGWYVQEPFADPEIFYFPEGIGPVKLVKVEHEEVVLMPRHIDKGLKKVSFKIALSDEIVNAMKVLRALGLDRKEKIEFQGIRLSPRDVVEAVAPNPAYIGDKLKGKMCVGVHVTGKKGGLHREVFIYQCLDNQETMERLGCQVVVAQTAYGTAIALELISKGIWQGRGVFGPEAFAPEPFLKLMDEYSYPYRLLEMDSEYKRKQDQEAMKKLLSASPDEPE